MTINWIGLRDVAVVGLIAGVGLVALFAVGVRALSIGSPRIAPDTTDAGAPYRPPPFAIALAALCFLVCALVAAYGLYVLIKK